MNAILFRPHYWICFAWGAAVLCSWIGWGRIAQRVLRLQHHPPLDWPCAATWGVGITLALAGALMLIHAAAAPELIALVLIGCAYALLPIIPLRHPRRSPLPPRIPSRTLPRTLAWFAWLIPTGTFVLLACLSAVEWRFINFFDDFPAYFTFVQRILQTGTLLEPMSWRRLSTYGGQQLLQAQAAVFGNFLNVGIIDVGLAAVLLAGHLYFLLPRRSTRQRLTLAAFSLIILLIPIPRLNSQSEGFALVMFLGLARLLPLGRRCAAPLRLAILEGIVAAAIATLRIHLVAAIAVLIVLPAPLCLLFDRPQWRAALRHSLVQGTTYVLALLPWAIVLHQSSRSFLYPLFRGNQNPAFAIFNRPLTLPQNAAWLWHMLANPQMFLLLFPVILILQRRYLRSLLPLYGAAIITSVVTILSFNRSDFDNLYRYCMPMLFPVALAALAAQFRAPRRRAHWLAAALLLAGIVLANIYDILPQLGRLAANAQVSLTDPQPYVISTFGPIYRRAQNMIPPGAPFFAAVSYPNFFNYTRNPIDNADCPGAASLPPGMPLDRGPGALEHYFLALGIHYLIIVDFDRDHGFYDRPFWAKVAVDPTGRLPTDPILARFALRFMNVFGQLETPDRFIGAGGALIVLKLHDPPPPP